LDELIEQTRGNNKTSKEISFLIVSFFFRKLDQWRNFRSAKRYIQIFQYY